MNESKKTNYRLDTSSELIQEHIQAAFNKKALWLADEHISSEEITNHLEKLASLDVISNRFHAIQSDHFHFNDFKINTHQVENYDVVFIRLPKERALYKHLITLAFNALTLNGVMFLSGAKNEGIQSAVKFSQEIFNNQTVKLDKIKPSALYSVEKIQLHCQQDAIEAYQAEHILKNIDADTANEQNHLKIISKAGQYGWQKIDLGSQLLASHFEEIFESFTTPVNSFLDLGCGYGYLTLQTQSFDLKSRTATDNNAAALLSCKKNCIENNIDCQVIPSDTAQQIEPSFDWIVCNPPFHKGFFNQPFLLTNFLKHTQRLLSSKGKACFVTNEFIPLEREARKYFKEATLLTHNQGFKVHILNN